MKRLPAALTALAMAGATSALAAGAFAQPASAETSTTTIDVATTGSDTNSGTAEQPLRTVQKAVSLATPGVTIRIHAGTYEEQVKIRTSGTAAAPITLTTAGDGQVTLTSQQDTAACSATAPNLNRTLLMTGGVDYWTIKGLTIHNGVFATGAYVNDAFNWYNGYIVKHDWATRRALAGRGTNDPVAAMRAVDELAEHTGKAIDPADGLRFIDNVVTGRGIHAALARKGVLSGNDIHDINCGTGPAVWLISFSDGWTVTQNHVARVAETTVHYMQEGIRLGMASNYNTVSDNVIEDLPGDGRAFTTDSDSSFNTFERNRASNVGMGFNDQLGGWGNTWRNNTVVGFRNYAFAYRLMDNKLTQPTLDTSTYKTVVRCNVAAGTGRALGVGGMKASSLSSNAFSKIWVSANAQKYWTAQGNTWNGTSAVPVASVSPSTAGC